MKKILKIVLPGVFILSILVTLSIYFTSTFAAPTKMVVGYVYGSASGIDPTKLTHVNYAFGNINGNSVSADTNALKSLVGLKSKNPDLKIVLSIGGWGAEGFSDAALSDSSRTAFANSCKQIIDNTGIDGVDLDWEYPVNGGWGVIKARPEDKQNYTLLLQKIRDIIGTGKILTIAGGAGTEFINNTELSKIAAICNYINLMTYDYGASSHNANLYNTSNHSAGISGDSAVNNYISAGVPANKLNLGIPFYGRYGSEWPTYSQLVANYINKNGWTRQWDAQAKACYLTNSSGGFITYDDEETIGYKAAYINSKGLGGAMFWHYTQDNNGALLNKIWDGLNGGTVTKSPINSNPVTTSVNPSVTATSGTYQQWSASKVYVNGDIVSYNSKNYKAKWWTQGEVPASSEAWELISSAIKTTVQPTVPNTTPSSGGTAWSAYTSYKVGDVVTFENIAYSCRIAHTSLPGWEPPIVPALWLKK